MQEQEYNILEALRELDNPSQRRLAEETNLSLGKVNAIIKRLVNRGLLQVERLNTRHFKYILTPGGIKELTTRSLNYIKKSYQAVQEISRLIRSYGQEARSNGGKLYLFGPDDEVRELAGNILNEDGISHILLDSLDEIQPAASDLADPVLDSDPANPALGSDLALDSEQDPAPAKSAMDPNLATILYWSPDNFQTLQEKFAGEESIQVVNILTGEEV